MNEADVLALCQKAGIQPHREESTGRLFFRLRDLEILRNSNKGPQSGRNGTSHMVQAPMPPQASLEPAKSAYASMQKSAALGMSRSDLSNIVESVSNAKEEILKDLSQLLDDKLSGLDEVVVELIRSKSDNDALREELRKMEESRNQYQAELSKFKPAAFGFYRKES